MPGWQDPTTGVLTYTETPPVAQTPAEEASSSVPCLPFKLASKAMGSPQKLVVGIARSVLGGTAFGLNPLVGVTGQAGFHLVNGTSNALYLETFNQADAITLLPFKTYNVAPGEEATCVAMPLESAKVQGVQYRLNHGPKARFMRDGAHVKAVQVNPTLASKGVGQWGSTDGHQTPTHNKKFIHNKDASLWA
jgi:hypothetical protein